MTTPNPQSRPQPGVAIVGNSSPRGRLARALGAAWRELSGAPAPATTPARRVARAAYQGAENSRLRLDWRAGNNSADTDIRGALTTVRARGRDLARNNPYIERFPGLLNFNVIGSKGITHVSQVRDARGELDGKLNDYLHEKFERWACGPVTVDGRMSLKRYMGLQIEGTAVDGESLTRTVIGRDFPCGIGLQPIDPDLLAESVNRRALRDAAEIRMGVEVDQFGRPQGYHVWDWPDYVPGSEYRGLQRIPASEILHTFRARRVHQTRGISWLTRVMVDIEDLAGYDEAVILGARAGANQMMVLQWKDPSLAAPPEEGRKPIQFELQTATATELDPGLEAVPFDPSQPSGVYADFTKTVLRRIASGLGLSYSSLSNDLREVNYSSTKVGLQAEREYWQGLQEWWIDSFMQPLYLGWLEAATLSGEVQLPGQDWRAFAAVEWVPRSWEWIEPQREVGACRDEIALGINSRQRIMREQSRDFFKVADELAQEVEYAREKGLNISGAAPAASGAQTPNDPAADPAGDSAAAAEAGDAAGAGTMTRAALPPRPPANRLAAALNGHAR